MYLVKVPERDIMTFLWNQMIPVVFQAIQHIALILILLGFATAFLWKAAFYFHFLLGFVTTLLMTYLVSIVNPDLQLTAIIFFAGVFISLLVAALGGVLCMIEGYTCGFLGFWALLATRAPGTMMSSSHLLSSLLAAGVTTGIAVILGNQVFSIGRHQQQPAPLPKAVRPLYPTSAAGTQSGIPIHRERIVGSAPKPVRGHETTCPTCQRLNTVGAKFCRICGEALTLQGIEHLPSLPQVTSWLHSVTG
jgi:hypothetical protein